MTYGILFMTLYKTTGRMSLPSILLFVAFALSYPVLFVLRDILCGGRSVAGRLLGLHIVDTATGNRPDTIKLIARNIFFFIYTVDGILLIATNQTIGDRVTNTTVVGK